MQSYPWSIQTKWHKHFSFPAHNVPARPSAADEVRLGTFPLKLKGSGWAASTYLQDSASTSWNKWFEKTTVREMFLFGAMRPLGLLRSLSSPSLNVLHENSKMFYFNIISVLFQWTYGGALHQTSTICKLTQLQLRIHRDLLQCVPFNHPTQCFEAKSRPAVPQFEHWAVQNSWSAGEPVQSCASQSWGERSIATPSPWWRFCSKEVQRCPKSLQILDYFATFQKFSVWFRIF